MRRLRLAGRAEAQRARQRRRVGQPRDRVRARALRPRPGPARGPGRRGHRDRVRRRSGGGPSRRCAESARATDRGCAPLRPARRAHAAPTPVLRLGMALVRACDAGRPLGRPALPSCSAAECAPSSGHDGHADLDRDARRLGLVRRRACARHRRDLLRGRGDHHDADPARPLARVERATQVRCGDSRADRARSERGTRAPRWPGGRRQHRRARGRRQVRRATRGEDRDRRRRRSGRVRGRPGDADGRADSARGAHRLHRWQARPSTRTGGSSSVRHVSARRRRSRRSRSSSPTRSPARRTRSGLPIASRRSSFPSCSSSRSRRLPAGCSSPACPRTPSRPRSRY